MFGDSQDGAHVTLCGPQTLMPAAIEQMGVNVTCNLEHALRDADVVMGLRIQRERLQGVFCPRCANTTGISASMRIPSGCAKRMC